MAKDETTPDEIQTRNEIMAGFASIADVLMQCRYRIEYAMRSPAQSFSR